MKSEISCESRACKKATVSLEEEFKLEEGLRLAMQSCSPLEASDLISNLVRQNFAAHKIIEQAADYIDGLETALIINVRSSNN